MIPPPEFLDIPYRYVEGHARISPAIIRFEDQIYSHKIGDQYHHWHVGKLHKMIVADELKPEALTIRLKADQLQYILEHRGIEGWYLSRIGPKLLRSPGILITWRDDDTDILADGAHRFVRRWREGLRDMRFFRITEEQARPAVLNVDGPLLEWVGRVKALHEAIHRATRGIV